MAEGEVSDIRPRSGPRRKGSLRIVEAAQSSRETIRSEHRADKESGCSVPHA